MYMDSLSLEGGEALSGDPLVALQLRCALAEERAADAESELVSRTEQCNALSRAVSEVVSVSAAAISDVTTAATWYRDHAATRSTAASASTTLDVNAAPAPLQVRMLLDMVTRASARFNDQIAAIRAELEQHHVQVCMAEARSSVIQTGVDGAVGAGGGAQGAPHDVDRVWSATPMLPDVLHSNAEEVGSIASNMGVPREDVGRLLQHGIATASASELRGMILRTRLMLLQQARQFDERTALAARVHEDQLTALATALQQQNDERAAAELGALRMDVGADEADGQHVNADAAVARASALVAAYRRELTAVAAERDSSRAECAALSTAMERLLSISETLQSASVAPPSSTLSPARALSELATLSSPRTFSGGSHGVRTTALHTSVSTPAPSRLGTSDAAAHASLEVSASADTPRLRNPLLAMHMSALTDTCSSLRTRLAQTTPTKGAHESGAALSTSSATACNNGPASGAPPRAPPLTSATESGLPPLGALRGASARGALLPADEGPTLGATACARRASLPDLASTWTPAEFGAHVGEAELLSGTAATLNASLPRVSSFSRLEDSDRQGMRAAVDEAVRSVAGIASRMQSLRDASSTAKATGRSALEERTPAPATAHSTARTVGSTLVPPLPLARPFNEQPLASARDSVQERLSVMDDAGSQAHSLSARTLNVDTGAPTSARQLGSARTVAADNSGSAAVALERAQRLQAELDSAQRTLAGQATELAQLHAAYELLQSTAADASASEAAACQEASKARADAAAAQAAAAAARVAAGDEAQAHASQQAILNAKLSALQEAYSALSTQRDELNAELSVLRASRGALDHHEAQAAAMAAQLKAADERTSALQASLAASDSVLTSLRRELELQHEAQRRAVSEADELRTMNASLRGELLTVTSRLAEAEVTASAQREAAQQAQAAQQRLLASAAETEAALAKARNVNVEQGTRAEAALLALRTEYDAAMAQQQQQLETVRQELTASQTAYHACAAQVSARDQQLADAQSALSTTRAEVTNLQRQVQQGQLDVQALHAQLAEALVAKELVLMRAPPMAGNAPQGGGLPVGAAYVTPGRPPALQSALPLVRIEQELTLDERAARQVGNFPGDAQDSGANVAAADPESHEHANKARSTIPGTEVEANDSKHALSASAATVDGATVALTRLSYEELVHELQRLRVSERTLIAQLLDLRQEAERAREERDAARARLSAASTEAAALLTQVLGFEVLPDTVADGSWKSITQVEVLLSGAVPLCAPTTTQHAIAGSMDAAAAQLRLLTLQKAALARELAHAYQKLESVGTAPAQWQASSMPPPQPPPPSPAPLPHARPAARDSTPHSARSDVTPRERAPDAGSFENAVMLAAAESHVAVDALPPSNQAQPSSASALVPLPMTPAHRDAHTSDGGNLGNARPTSTLPRTKSAPFAHAFRPPIPHTAAPAPDYNESISEVEHLAAMFPLLSRHAHHHQYSQSAAASVAGGSVTTPAAYARRYRSPAPERTGSERRNLSPTSSRAAGSSFFQNGVATLSGGTPWRPLAPPPAVPLRRGGIGGGTVVSATPLPLAPTPQPIRTSLRYAIAAASDASEKAAMLSTTISSRW